MLEIDVRVLVYRLSLGPNPYTCMGAPKCTDVVQHAVRNEHALYQAHITVEQYSLVCHHSVARVRA